jgi:hypothetical protein
MQNYPTVVSLPFADGVRDVPEHIAALFKAHQIPTHTLTYRKAMDRLDWMNADKAMNDAFNKIRDSHLRDFGI